MKKTIVVIAGLLIAILAHAEDTPYLDAMKTNLGKMGESRTKSDFVSVANQFLRIAEAEKDQWHPYYYSAYALTIAATMEQDPSAKDADSGRLAIRREARPAGTGAVR